jgi:hypothetical protein
MDILPNLAKRIPLYDLNDQDAKARDPKYPVFTSHEFPSTKLLNNLPIGGHEYFDITTRIETVQLIDQFQHCSLYFVISAGTIVETCAYKQINIDFNKLLLFK